MFPERSPSRNLIKLFFFGLRAEDSSTTESSDIFLSFDDIRSLYFLATVRLVSVSSSFHSEGNDAHVAEGVLRERKLSLVSLSVAIYGACRKSLQGPEGC